MIYNLMSIQIDNNKWIIICHLNPTTIVKQFLHLMQAKQAISGDMISKSIRMKNLRVSNLLTTSEAIH